MVRLREANWDETEKGPLVSAIRRPLVGLVDSVLVR